MQGVSTSTARRRSILHVGNVANNALENARVLSHAGFECHVAAYDYYHFASTSEARDLQSVGAFPTNLDPEYPDYWALGSRKPEVPAWFAIGPQFLVIEYLHLLRTAPAELADLARSCLNFQRFKATRLRTRWPQASAWTAEDLRRATAGVAPSPRDAHDFARARPYEDVLMQFRAVQRRFYSEATAMSLQPPYETAYVDAFLALDRPLDRRVRALRDSGESWACGFELDPGRSAPPPALPDGVRVEDAAPYAWVLPRWRALFAQYDRVICYGGTAVLALLACDRPWIAYEFGTIRTLPFVDDPAGRLIRAAYERADAVMITNTDFVSAERRLDLAAEKRYFVPHAFDDRALLPLASRRGRPPSADDPVRFLAPARQHWVGLAPDESKANDRIVRASALLRDRGATGFRVEFVAWGVDVDATRQLIRELGMDEWCAWISLMPRQEMWERFLAAHAVVDQFGISAIGGNTFEALALGVRCITYDNGINNREFFGEQPPLLAAHTSGEIADRMGEVLADPRDRAGIGARGAAWFDRRHSSARQVEIMHRILADLEGRSAPGNGV